MRVKKLLKNYAQQDFNNILNSEKGKTGLQALLEKTSQQNLGKQPDANLIICPDCGNELTFVPRYGRFMHENSEQLNCWYAANEFGKCVDNNIMRAKRIEEYNKSNLTI